MQPSLSSQMQLPWARTQPERASKHWHGCNSKQNLAGRAPAPASPPSVQLRGSAARGSRSLPVLCHPQPSSPAPLRPAPVQTWQQSTAGCRAPAPPGERELGRCEPWKSPGVIPLGRERAEAGSRLSLSSVPGISAKGKRHTGKHPGSPRWGRAGARGVGAVGRPPRGLWVLVPALGARVGGAGRAWGTACGQWGVGAHRGVGASPVLLPLHPDTHLPTALAPQQTRCAPCVQGTKAVQVGTYGGIFRNSSSVSKVPWD